MADGNYWQPIDDADTSETGFEGSTVITGGSGERLIQTNMELVKLRDEYQTIQQAKFTKVTDAAIEIWKLKHFDVNNEQSLRSFKEFMTVSPTWSGTVTVDGCSERAKKERYDEVMKIMAGIEDKYGDTKVEVKMA